jgi:rhodanese-related sulfurtransferase
VSHRLFTLFFNHHTYTQLKMSQNPEIEISVQAVSDLLNQSDDENQKCLLIDCREPGEYEHCQIAGSKLIPMNEIPERLSELESHRDETLIVHCHHGGRSLRVVEYLRANGFPTAQNMTGGIDVWSQQIDQEVPRY